MKNTNRVPAALRCSAVVPLLQMAVLLAYAGQVRWGAEWAWPVNVVQKSLLPTVAPGHDVVDGTGILKAHLPRHVPSLPKHWGVGDPTNEPIYGLTALQRNDVWVASPYGVNLAEAHELQPLWLVPVLCLALVV
jgi:hypothetical protein